jgi:hypothetical protein
MRSSRVVRSSECLYKVVPVLGLPPPPNILQHSGICIVTDEAVFNKYKKVKKKFVSSVCLHCKVLQIKICYCKSELCIVITFNGIIQNNVKDKILLNGSLDKALLFLQ